MVRLFCEEGYQLDVLTNQAAKHILYVFNDMIYI